MYPLDDTIAAIGSPPGGAARGMIRLSGPQVQATLDRCLTPHASRLLSRCRRPTVKAESLSLPGMASPLPCEVYFWPGARSYTGQPVAEIHTLGSPPLLEAALRTVCRCGARMARRGEFTMRAFLAGRIDLTQAEAVLGVIDAADAGELDVALAQLAGGLGRHLHQLRERLVDLLAELEAGLDFPDEDLPFITSEELHRRLQEAVRAVARLSRQVAARSDSAEMTRVVLVGARNVGKSSLFNALVGETGALVADQPGTTRDYLTATLDLDGVKCQLIDTAGMGEEDAPADAATWDAVERSARAVSREQRRAAHVQLVCVEAGRPCTGRQWEQPTRPADRARLVAWTKVDLARPPEGLPEAIATSSRTGEGLGALRDELRRAVLTAAARGGEVVAGTAARCRDSLRLAAESLDRAREIVEAQGGEELVAAEIRVALDELGRVVGAVYTDDVLDRIFSRFCIGK